MNTSVKSILHEWESRAKQRSTVYFEFEETVVDRVWKQTTKKQGVARYMAPRMARIDYIVDGNLAPAAIVTNQGELFIGDSEHNELRLRSQKVEVSEWFLRAHPLIFFSGRIEEARLLESFWLEKVTEFDEFFRLDLKERRRPPRKWFTFSENFEAKHVEVVLDKSSLMPLWVDVEEYNLNETTYKITRCRMDVALTKDDFAAIAPKGWRVIRFPF